jgi:hypothetical protein
MPHPGAKLSPKLSTGFNIDILLENRIGISVFHAKKAGTGYRHKGERVLHLANSFLSNNKKEIL